MLSTRLLISACVLSCGFSVALGLVKGGSRGSESQPIRSLSQNEACENPKSPRNGRVSCSISADSSTCTGTCKPGHAFPDGSVRIDVECSKYYGVWSPISSFPDCLGSGGSAGYGRTVSNPGSYGQSSYSHSSSSSSSSYGGDNGQYQSIQGQEARGSHGTCAQPKSPLNGRLSCSMSNGEWTCDATCSTGYSFSDGGSQATLTCSERTGRWSPTDKFEDCTAPDNCEKPAPPMNGRFSCQISGTHYSCVGTCFAGYSFPGGSTTLNLECSQRTGIWSPSQKFPDCIGSGGSGGYGQRVDPGSYSESHSYSHSSSGTTSLGNSNQRQSHSGSQLEGSGQSYQGHRTRGGQMLCQQPKSPKNGGFSCSMTNGEWTCQATCPPGYFFPDGSSETRIECNENGRWSPKGTFEDCSAPSNCEKPSPPMNGRYECEITGTHYTCTGSCSAGYAFPSGSSAMKLECTQRTGVWSPSQKFPDCVGGGSGGSRGYASGGGYPGSYSESHGSSQSLSGGTSHGGRDGTQSHQGLGGSSSYETNPGSYSESHGSSHSTSGGTSHGSSDQTHTYQGSYGEGSDQMQSDQGFDMLQFQRSCQQPKSPMNGAIQCSMSNGLWECRATCNPGYSFPDGSSKATATCSERNGQWSPREKFDDCGGQGSGAYGGYGQSITGQGSGGSSKGYGQTSGSSGQSHGYGQYSSSSSSSSSGKTTYGEGSDQNQIFQGLQAGQACQQPKSPMNGAIHCSMANGKWSCQATCNPGYEFPDRSRQATVKCSERDGHWTPREKFEDCQLLCHPPCENGGRCAVHNQCMCPSTHRGNRCQYATALCDFNRLSGGSSLHAECSHNPEFTECNVSCPPGMTFVPPGYSQYRCTVNGLWNPPTPPKCKGGKSTRTDSLCEQVSPPKNGEIECRGSSEVLMCTGSCKPGYTFPQGFSELTVKCDKNTGEWDPTKNIPDCEAICSPKCENGGKCVGQNSCHCPIAYKGRRCEHPVSNCDTYDRLGSVSHSCTSTERETVCRVHCGRTRRKLQPGHPTIYTCSADGTWRPNFKPICVSTDFSSLIDPRLATIPRHLSSSSQLDHSSTSDEDGQSGGHQHVNQQIGEQQIIGHDEEFEGQRTMNEDITGESEAHQREHLHYLGHQLAGHDFGGKHALEDELQLLGPDFDSQHSINHEFPSLPGKGLREDHGLHFNDVPEPLTEGLSKHESGHDFGGQKSFDHDFDGQQSINHEFPSFPGKRLREDPDLKTTVQPEPLKKGISKHASGHDFGGQIPLGHDFGGPESIGNEFPSFPDKGLGEGHDLQLNVVPEPLREGITKHISGHDLGGKKPLGHDFNGQESINHEFSSFTGKGHREDHGLHLNIVPEPLREGITKHVSGHDFGGKKPLGHDFGGQESFNHEFSLFPGKRHKEDHGLHLNVVPEPLREGLTTHVSGQDLGSKKPLGPDFGGQESISHEFPSFSGKGFREDHNLHLNVMPEPLKEGITKHVSGQDLGSKKPLVLDFGGQESISHEFPSFSSKGLREDHGLHLNVMPEPFREGTSKHVSGHDLGSKKPLGLDFDGQESISHEFPSFSSEGLREDHGLHLNVMPEPLRKGISSHVTGHNFGGKTTLSPDFRGKESISHEFPSFLDNGFREDNGLHLNVVPEPLREGITKHGSGQDLGSKKPLGLDFGGQESFSHEFPSFSSKGLREDHGLHLNVMPEPFREGTTKHVSGHDLGSKKPLGLDFGGQESISHEFPSFSSKGLQDHGLHLNVMPEPLRKGISSHVTGHNFGGKTTLGHDFGGKESISPEFPSFLDNGFREDYGLHLNVMPEPLREGITKHVPGHDLGGKKPLGLDFGGQESISHEFPSFSSKGFREDHGLHLNVLPESFREGTTKHVSGQDLGSKKPLGLDFGVLESISHEFPSFSSKRLREDHGLHLNVMPEPLRKGISSHVTGHNFLGKKTLGQDFGGQESITHESSSFPGKGLQGDQSLLLNDLSELLGEEASEQNVLSESHTLPTLSNRQEQGLEEFNVHLPKDLKVNPQRIKGGKYQTPAADLDEVTIEETETREGCQ